MKLSDGTGLIGKKACFAFNQKLYRREEYEGEGHLQAAYPVIHFMHYIAFFYHILDVNHQDGFIIFGEKYEVYQAASPLENK